MSDQPQAYSLPINDNTTLVVKGLDVSGMTGLGTTRPTVKVLDISGSMQKHYDTMFKVARMAYNAGSNVIVFSAKAQLIQAQSDEVTPDLTLQTLGQAVGSLTNYDAALELVKAMIVPNSSVEFFTDGEPNLGCQWRKMVKEIHEVLDSEQGGQMNALYLSGGQVTNQSRINMEALCTSGRLPQFVIDSSFSEDLKDSNADNLKEVVLGHKYVAIGAYSAQAVSPGDVDATLTTPFEDVKSISQVCGIAAAVLLLLKTQAQAHDNSFPMLQVVRTLNAWLSPFQHHEGYGIAAMIGALREVAATFGMADVKAPEFENLLKLAGVMSAMTPEVDTPNIVNKLAGLLTLAKIASANNAPKHLRDANKALLKIQARMGPTLGRMKALASKTQQALLQGYPYQALELRLDPELTRQLKALKAEGVDKTTEAVECASSTAVIQSPVSMDLVAGDILEIKSISDHREGTLVCLYIPGEERRTLASGQLVLGSFAWAQGVIATKQSPFMLANTLFHEPFCTPDSVRRSMMVVDTLKAYVEQDFAAKKENPFNLTADGGVHFAYGHTLRDPADPTRPHLQVPNMRVALLSAVLQSSSAFTILNTPEVPGDDCKGYFELAEMIDLTVFNIGYDMLVQLLLPLVHKVVTLADMHSMTTRMVMQFGYLPQTMLDIVSELEIGDRGRDTLQALTSLYSVSVDIMNPNDSWLQDMVADMITLHRTQHKLAGVAPPVPDPDTVAKLFVFQGGIIGKYTIPALVQVCQNVTMETLVRDSPIFARALAVASVKVAVAHKVVNHKLGAAELAVQMQALSMQVKGDTLEFTLPETESGGLEIRQGLVRDYVYNHVRDSYLGPKLGEYASLLNIHHKVPIPLVVREVVEEDRSTSLLPFEVVNELVQIVRNNAGHLWQRLDPETMKEGPTLAWSKKTMLDFMKAVNPDFLDTHKDFVDVYARGCFLWTPEDAKALPLAQVQRVLGSIHPGHLLCVLRHTPSYTTQFPVFTNSPKLMGVAAQTLWDDMLDEKQAIPVRKVRKLLAKIVVYPAVMDKFYSKLLELLTLDSKHKSSNKSCPPKSCILLADSIRSDIRRRMDANPSPGLHTSSAQVQYLVELNHLLKSTYTGVRVPPNVAQMAQDWAHEMAGHRAIPNGKLTRAEILEFAKDRLTRGHAWIKKHKLCSDFETFVSVRLAMEEEDPNTYGPKLAKHNTVLRVLPFCTRTAQGEWQVPGYFVDGIEAATLP